MSETLSPMEFAIGSNAASANARLGCATKKVHRRFDMRPYMDDPTVDGNGQSVAKVSHI